MSRTCASLLLFGLLAVPLRGQDKISINVDANARLGPLRPVWAFFGHDEPNFTYMKHGRKLLGELAALSPAPVYVRTHYLLCTGDGTPALKWGSSNAYREDASGGPVYDWTILDRIFDTYQQHRVRPLVEIGFMPKALSVKLEPYEHNWPEEKLHTGWAYPPTDYRKWAELVYQWVRHAVERYGRTEVESWYWEAWNEPDIHYWQGTAEEYHKLYDFTADAVKRALPTATVGGPHSTSPSREEAAQFLREFLEHCVRGTNHATGGTGAPLDYIGFHAKGRPQVVDGHVRMSISKQLRDIATGFEIVASFPELRNLPVIIGESDPEGCAACSARVYPHNAYRNGPLYPVYTAAVMKRIFELAGNNETNIRGVLSWAFEFEDQPYFDGFRTLSTNGIDKPVLNVFRMFGLMGGDRVKVASSGAVSLDDTLQSGVRAQPDVNALASRRGRELSVMAWNYHDDDLPGPEARTMLRVAGIPASARRVLLRHYRIDHNHSNAYTVWKQMGSPQAPTAEQYARLEAAGQLELLRSPEWLRAESGRVTVEFGLPRQAVSLLQLSW